MKAFPERTPVKLEFNHPELESLALEHLESRVTMALQSLTVNEFVFHILAALHAPRSVMKSRFKAMFRSKSM